MCANIFIVKPSAYLKSLFCRVNLQTDFLQKLQKGFLLAEIHPTKNLSYEVSQRLQFVDHEMLTHIHTLLKLRKNVNPSLVKTQKD